MLQRKVSRIIHPATAVVSHVLDSRRHVLTCFYDPVIGAETPQNGIISPLVPMA